MTELYRRPDEYDLEHVGDEEDVAFYVALARSLRPKSVLEARVRDRQNYRPPGRGR